MREWRYSSTILDLSTRCRCVVIFTLPCSFIPRETAPGMYLLYRRLGEPQSRSGLNAEERNFLLLPGIEPQLLVIQPIA
jgi:hypothetical protein